MSGREQDDSNSWRDRTTDVPGRRMRTVISFRCCGRAVIACQPSRVSEAPTVVGRNQRPILFVDPVNAIPVLPGHRSAVRFARHEGIRYDGEKYRIDDVALDAGDSQLQIQALLSSLRTRERLAAARGCRYP